MNGADEEFVPDLPDEASAESGEEAIQKLREKLKKAVAEKQEYLDGWQRSRADFANYKREEAADAVRREERFRGEFVESMLPALDAFELALKHAPSEELRMVHKQLIVSLQRLNVERFGEEGENYDPHLHEALVQKGNGEKIISVERSGYKINDYIIRAAQVII